MLTPQRKQILLQNKTFITKMEKYVELSLNKTFIENEINCDIYDLYNEHLKLNYPRFFGSKVLCPTQDVFDDKVFALQNDFQNLQTELMTNYQLTLEELQLLSKDDLFDYVHEYAF